jgi:tetratricopeptide (TPR) repeat protein
MTAYVNPYDFERPVKDPSLFAGRQKELEEINYYLELSKSERPVYHNLAIIGPRAVGKTSLLNMIEHIATDKGMLAVKISLNNETSANEVILFKEIFDNLMTKGAEMRMYGGISDQIYKSFRRVIDLFDVSAEIPFLFGTAYIGFKKGQNTSLSQQIMVHDLKKVYDEAKNKEIPTIVLLFDESDLFSKNKTLLQKLRNVFSELDGYILVFCGTEKMFPDMSEVFSPVPRLFKRIDVGNFPSVAETKDCILKPLTDEEKKIVNEGSIGEIHAVSGGNPYEVQLLSHFMYRRFREQNTSNITLGVEVLDNVLRELERLRLGGHHEIANMIRRLIATDQLRTVLAVLECPNATPDQLARFLVLPELDSTDIQDISSKVSRYELSISDFVGKIMQKDDQNRLAFAGDQFDVLYLKHFSLSKGVKEFFFGMPNEVDINIQNKFTNVLLKDLLEYEVNVRFDAMEPLGTSDGYKAQKFIYGGKFKPKPTKPGEWAILFEFTIAEVEKRFYQGSPDSLRFRVNVRFLGRGFVIQITTKTSEDLAYVKKRLSELQTKLQVLGFDILPKDEVEYNLEGHNHARNKDYTLAIESFNAAIKLNSNFELAWANKGMVYFQLKNYAEALKCFEKWSTIRPRSAEAWERIGATLVELHRYEEARTALQKATELQPEMWVAWDNFGRALYFLKQFDGALEALDRAIRLKPDDFGAVLFKGFVLHEMGQLEEAVKCYNMVLQADPSNFDALVNKGVAMREKGDSNLALEMLKKALLLNPDNTDVLIELSLAYDLNGQTDEAIQGCDKILELNPKHSLAYYDRACFRCKRGNLEEAFSDLEKAIGLDARFKGIAKVEKDFDRIKNDTRFKELVS